MSFDDFVFVALFVIVLAFVVFMFVIGGDFCYSWFASSCSY